MLSFLFYLLLICSACNLLSGLPSRYHLRADCYAGAASSLEQREAYQHPGWGTARRSADFTEKILNVTCVLLPAANSSIKNHNAARTVHRPKTKHDRSSAGTQITQRTHLEPRRPNPHQRVPIFQGRKLSLCSAFAVQHWVPGFLDWRCE